MKKILTWFKNEGNAVTFFTIAFCVVLIMIGGCVHCSHIKTPVEKPVNVDSIKGANAVIEKQINDLDSIKYEIHNKIDSLDDNATIELFKQLLSE